MHGYNLSLRILAMIMSLVFLVVPAYHLVEQPMINLGSKLARKAENQHVHAVPIG